MDIDKTTCAATLWMAFAGAADLVLPGSHPAGVAIALLAAAPFALRVGVLASRSETPGRLSARDAEALAWAQPASDARPDRGGADGPGEARTNADWRRLALL